MALKYWGIVKITVGHASVIVPHAEVMEMEERTSG